MVKVIRIFDFFCASIGFNYVHLIIGEPFGSIYLKSGTCHVTSGDLYSNYLHGILSSSGRTFSLIFLKSFSEHYRGCYFAPLLEYQR